LQWQQEGREQGRQRGGGRSLFFRRWTSRTDELITHLAERCKRNRDVRDEDDDAVSDVSVTAVCSLDDSRLVNDRSASTSA